MKNKRIFLLLTILLIFVAIATSNKTNKTKTTTKKPEGIKAPKCISNCTQKEKAKFEEFKANFSRTYKNRSDECKALKNFCRSYRSMLAHNNDKNATFKMALTGYEDNSKAEKAERLISKSGLKLDEKFMNKIMNVTPEKLLKYSAKMNQYTSSLRAKSIKVTGAEQEVNLGPYSGPVKDQGHCGADWSFCAVSTLQFQQVALEKKGNIMSEQMIIDCNGQGQNCSGGNPFYALKVAETGVVAQAQYPFKQQDSTCKMSNKINTVYKSSMPACSGQVTEEELKQLADGYGVMGVVIGVTDSLISYTSGIYYDTSCPTKPTHCVTLVGYGTDSNGVDYWVLKNSWGRYYGEKGYFKLRRGVNACGIGSTIVFLPCEGGE